MDRRTFLKTGLIGGAGAALVSPSPVLADHITEPMTPIIGIGLEVYQYTSRNATFMSIYQVIPEDGVQPPGSYPVTVEIRDAVNHDLVVGTIQAYELRTIHSTVPIDTATGLPLVNFNMRVEPKVAIALAARRAGNPSEHWRETLKVNRIAERNHRRYLWAVPWNHANTGPHTKFSSGFGGSSLLPKAIREIAGYAETAQANQSLELIPAGTRLEFEHQMFTDMTNRVFYQTFQVVVGEAQTPTTTTTAPGATTTTGGNVGGTTTTTAPPTTTTAPGATTTTASTIN